MGLGERMAQVQGAVRIGRALIKQGLKLAHEIALVRLAGQLHPRGPGAVEGRRQGQGARIGALGALEVAGELARGGQIVEEARIVRRGGHGGLEERQGPGMVAGPGEHHPYGVQGQAVGRSQGHRLIRRPQGLGASVEGDEGAGQIGVVPGRAGRQVHGLGEQFGRPERVVMIGGDHPQQEPGAAVGGVLAQRGKTEFVRLLIGALGHLRLGQIQQTGRFSHLARPLSMR